MGNLVPSEMMSILTYRNVRVSAKIVIFKLVNDSNYFRKAPMASGGVWHGMTIRDILEKVDLFNITTVEEDTRKEKKEFSPMALGNYSTNEDGKTIVQVSDPTSAYLGKSIIIELYRNFNHINVFLGPNCGTSQFLYQISWRTTMIVGSW